MLTTIRQLSALHGIEIPDLIERCNRIFPKSKHSADFPRLSPNRVKEVLAIIGKSVVAGNQTDATTALPGPGAAPSTNPSYTNMNNSGVMKMDNVNAYDQQTTENWAQRQWDADAELRAEFGNDRASWLAYAHADAQGKVKGHVRNGGR